MNIAKDLCQLIGNTPLLKISRFAGDDNLNILGKLETNNPGASVKDRIALSMIEAAEDSGALKKGYTIVEPTSGNTGIGLAWVAAVKGYRIILTMPESMSVERRKILQALGAELVLTPAPEGMEGAVLQAKTLSEQIGNTFMPQQFQNPANPLAHYKTTGEEIWRDTEGKVDILVAGVGTGGTISGTGKLLKEKNSDIKVIAVEPRESAVISGSQPGPHMIQGIGAGFIPGNFDSKVVDEVVTVTSKEAIEAARRLTKTEGLLAGISSGANALASLRIAQRPENAGKCIVTIICDTGERYLSTILYYDD